MTRREFIEEVVTWYELKNFCDEEQIDFCDDVYSDEEKDDYIDERLGEITTGSSWQDVLGVLSDIPTAYDYYFIEDVYDIRGADDDDFERRKQSVLEYYDNNEYWDEEEEEPVYVDEEDYEDEADEFVADTSVALDDFFVSSAEDLDKITTERKANEAKANADFDKFTQRVTTVGDY